MPVGVQPSVTAGTDPDPATRDDAWGLERLSQALASPRARWMRRHRDKGPLFHKLQEAAGGQGTHPAVQGPRGGEGPALSVLQLLRRQPGVGAAGQEYSLVSSPGPLKGADSGRLDAPESRIAS